MSLHVVLGGTRSGKSAHAEGLAAATGLAVTYVATGAMIDAEMRERIAAHRARRPAAWATAEPGPGTDPLRVAADIAAAGGCALVDGLGGGLATAQYEATGPGAARDAVLAAARDLAAAAPAARGAVVVVAELAGAGLTPPDPVSRAWIDLLGETTRALADAAATVELVVAGRVLDLGGRPAEPDPALRVHGDVAVRPGDADHAVNVLAGGPPGWLRAALAAGLGAGASRYPDDREAAADLAALHGRHPSEVLPANGAAEALWLLGPALRPRLAAVVHPGFTETEAGLHAHRVPVARVHRDPDRDFALDPGTVPEGADLVVIGNPVSPSGTLDPRDAVLALRRPGRTVVVDEAFMDLVPGQPASLAGESLPDVLVVRSLTKALAIPGVRAGYALGAPALIARLRAVRPPWSVNAPALAALRAAARRPGDLAAAAERARAEREDLVDRLDAAGVRSWPSHTNFVLVAVDDGPGLVARLREQRIAVRHAVTFPGLGPDHVRLTARDPEANARLVEALCRVPA